MGLSSRGDVAGGVVGARRAGCHKAHVRWGDVQWGRRWTQRITGEVAAASHRGEVTGWLGAWAPTWRVCPSSRGVGVISRHLAGGRRRLLWSLSGLWASTALVLPALIVTVPVVAVVVVVGVAVVDVVWSRKTLACVIECPHTGGRGRDWVPFPAAQWCSGWMPLQASGQEA
ncbi:hypothetical protein BKA70DRAFT_1214650 [Coprinopsis sp. MPI-PUGE-AT-0042]|nr:hypothetical protein BKA70DRAFT_1214650 [Coprinopsis sp. MPI-PUGE-AT-0042]